MQAQRAREIQAAKEAAAATKEAAAAAEQAEAVKYQADRDTGTVTVTAAWESTSIGRQADRPDAPEEAAAEDQEVHEAGPAAPASASSGLQPTGPLQLRMPSLAS